jgi:ribA/ribD-fused uncharacterized protein
MTDAISSNVLLNTMWQDYIDADRGPASFKRIVGAEIERLSKKLSAALQDLQEARAAHEPGASDELYALLVRRGYAQHEAHEIANMTARIEAGQPAPRLHLSEEECAELARPNAQASQPPSLLREVAAIAYDTSKAAEDRIRDIQDLWEGATAPPSAGPLTLDTDSQVFFYEQDHYYLSNFSAFRLRWDGIDFDTSEHAYHWEKFKISGVDTSRVGRLIYGARSAHEAFKIAEALKGERRADWDSVKVDAMRRILREKARQHEYVRRKLLETGARQLIENSWRDDYWGWGEKRDGQNMLGKLWMEIRAELHGSSQTKSCEACRATTADDCYFSEDPPANCAFRATAGESGG